MGPEIIFARFLASQTQKKWSTPVTHIMPAVAVTLLPALVFGAFPPPHLRAQDPLSLSERENRALVFGFVTMVDSLRKQIAAQRSDSTTGARGLKESGMSMLGVTEDEFIIITDVCAEATAKLGDWHKEALQHFNAERAAGRRPSSEERAKFERKRTRILEDTIGKLKQRLPAKAWHSVSSFINVEMRSGLVSKPLPAEK